ncbi:MAG: class I SAM-dependent methyltransferase [Bilifractor sp.]|nr:class I SAM-dependent methyltransferase [Bilifractor sp.]
MANTPIINKMSERLLSVAALVTPGNRTADIGTDHGYVPVYLVENGIVTSAIAMDVRKGPLARAQETVTGAGLSDRIELRLSDGFEKLKPGEADTAVIAGMGGMLICHILTAHPETTASLKELVLEPQSEVDKVRRLLSEIGFTITDERMIFEDGKYYPIMKAEKRPSSPAVLGEMEEHFGPVLLQRRDPILRKYLAWQIQVNEQIAVRLAMAGSENSMQRLQEVKEELRLLLAAYSRYEM